MKKIKSLFIREFENHNTCNITDKVEVGCEWVLNEECIATEKIDGTCCLIQDNKIYRRFDFKEGRKLPNRAIPCQEKADETTGHFPHWVLCEENNPMDKYHIEAFKQKENWENGTYELIGKHFQANPYELQNDILEKHGSRIINCKLKSFDAIKEYLYNHNIEGIVFYRNNGEMCKIKKTDFMFYWNGKNYKLKTNSIHDKESGV